MKYKNMYRKKCLVCGKEFEHGRSNKDCCSPECTYKKKLEYGREYNRQRAIEGRVVTVPVKVTPPKGSLAEFNARARALGMSYGQYDLARRMGRVASE